MLSSDFSRDRRRLMFMKRFPPFAFLPTELPHKIIYLIPLIWGRFESFPFRRSETVAGGKEKKSLFDNKAKAPKINSKTIYGKRIIYDFDNYA